MDVHAIVNASMQVTFCVIFESIAWQQHSTFLHMLTPGKSSALQMANYLERSIQSHSLSFLLFPIFLMWPYVCSNV